MRVDGIRRCRSQVVRQIDLAATLNRFEIQIRTSNLAKARQSFNLLAAAPLQSRVCRHKGSIVRRRYVLNFGNE